MAVNWGDAIVLIVGVSTGASPVSKNKPNPPCSDAQQGFQKKGRRSDFHPRSSTMN